LVSSKVIYAIVLLKIKIIFRETGGKMYRRGKNKKLSELFKKKDEEDKKKTKSSTPSYQKKATKKTSPKGLGDKAKKSTPKRSSKKTKAATPKGLGSKAKKTTAGMYDTSSAAKEKVAAAKASKEKALMHSKTHQDLINAAYKAAEELKIAPWVLLRAAKWGHFTEDRGKVYDGPMIDEIDTLEPAQKQALKKVLGL
jgi:hypothetical protein